MHVVEINMISQWLITYQGCCKWVSVAPLVLTLLAERVFTVSRSSASPKRFHFRINRALQSVTVHEQNQIPSPAHPCKHQEWHFTVSVLLFAPHEYQPSLQITQLLTRVPDYIVTHCSRWRRLACHCSPPPPVRPAGFFLDYAFFIDYADGSSAHSSVQCTTHSQQGCSSLLEGVPVAQRRLTV